MIVFINPNSEHGQSLLKWNRIREELRLRIGAFDTMRIDTQESFKETVKKAVRENGHRKLIAAGGDGTVHQLLNAVMDLDAPGDVTIGAVGLGSSNDFHKPFTPDSQVGGLPVRTDFRNSQLYDVIKVDFRGAGGETATRYSLINASIGITAEGNALFNAKKSFIRNIQALSVDLAIMVSAIAAILIYRDIKSRIKIDDSPWQPVEISNLGIIKNPHFTGDLCYDTAIQPDDGELGVNLCSGLNIAERIRLLMALRKHRFSELPKTRCWKAQTAAVTAERPFSLEIDGEVFLIDRAVFEVLPQRIRCCP